MTDPTNRGTVDLDRRLTSVEVDEAHIKYRVYEDRLLSLGALVSGGFRNRASTVVHAVKGVTLDFRVGDAVGIVGSNGSGKSSLLRAIGGLQSLSSGSVRVRGEAHLLGVGAALKPSLSGYRNVMLGGLAMGLARAEIEAQFDDIVDFSGLGDAMARPLVTYSSGMRARLAFSIATLRIPDVLLIDEGLAVGDRDFKVRSLERINEIRDNAGTVIMVTHNLYEIRWTCNRAIWLDNGTIRADGEVEDVLAMYESS